MRWNLWVVGIVLLSAATGGSAEKPEVLAQTAAESWLKLVDGGNLEASWSQAAQLFKGSITLEQWKQQCQAARGPLGKLISRKLKTQEYKEALPGAPDGKYVVLQYDASFEHKAAALETVTPMLDQDGVWRVGGYFIK